MSFLRYAFVLLASTPGLAAAATRIWPGAAPCAADLQACVDAAADGDVIEIATNAPVTSSLVLSNRSLSLVAADGYAAGFSGAVLTATGNGSGDIDVRVRGLRFHDSILVASYAGSGTANFDLRGLVLMRTPGTSGNAVRVIARGGTVNAMLYDNRILGRPLNGDALLMLRANGATLNADAYYNRIESSSAAAVEGSGIRAEVQAEGGTPGGGTIKLHGNDVRGGFRDSAIVLSETSAAAGDAPSAFRARAYSNVVVGAADAEPCRVGIEFLADRGRIDAQAINNTVTRCELGIAAGPHPGGGTGSVIEGLLKNNLIVSSSWSIWLTPETTSGIENDYNLIAENAIYGAAPGPHTITADARLVAPDAPRLRADSPAIDAADTGTLGFGVILNRLPSTDADGLRRIKNPAGSGADKADIGAYEFGDVSFVHSTAAANTDDYISTIDHPAGNDRPGADLFLTPNFDGGDNSAVTFNRPFGVWYEGTRWTVFDQGGVAMPQYVDFDVFAPASGGGVFRHVADAENTADWFSQLDDGSVNALPDRIVLVTQNFSAGPAYNIHPVGAFYFSFGGPGAWMVANLDMSDLPLGAGFGVYAQEPSPNAFRVTARAANTLGSGLVLDHPLLNGSACAQPMVTRLFDGNPVAGHFDVDYDSGRWRIFSYDGMPAGTPFHVLVNPAQVFECRDRLFADDFD